MTTLCVHILLGSLISGAALAQVAANQTPGAACEISEIANPAGWTIPGLSRTSTKMHAPWTTGGLEGIFVDVMESNTPEATVIFASTVREHSGRVQFREQPVNVKEILRFSMNDHFFAYRIAVEFVAIEGKKRIPVGSEVMVTFYDEDGSGRFTVMRYQRGLLNNVTVPEWIKRPHN